MRLLALALALALVGSVAPFDLAPGVALACAEPAPCIDVPLVAPEGTLGARLVVRSSLPGSAWVLSAQAEGAFRMVPGNAMEPGVNAWAFFAPEPTTAWTLSVYPTSGAVGSIEILDLEWLPAGCDASWPVYEEGLTALEAVTLAREAGAARGLVLDEPPTVHRRHRDADLEPAVFVSCPGREAQPLRDAWSVAWPGYATLLDARSGDVLRAW